VESHRSKYQGFDFSQFHQKVAEMENVAVSRFAVGRVLKAAGSGWPKKRHPPKHRAHRSRLLRLALLLLAPDLMTPFARKRLAGTGRAILTPSFSLEADG